MTDDAFLAALAQTPDDADLRAVYADFLDDAGRCDAAELMRADEAMRRVPVWSDEYWTLKNRRNDLRRVLPPEWLRATRLDSSRPERVFRDGYPDGVRERWRFLRAFTETWYGGEMPDVGGRREEIDAEERRVDLTLGESLRQLVAYRRDIPAAAIDFLGDMSFSYDRSHEDTLDIGGEAPYITYSVMAARAGEDDPPVRSTMYFEPFDENPERPEAAATVTFLTVTTVAHYLISSRIPTRCSFAVTHAEAAAAFGPPKRPPADGLPTVYLDDAGVLAFGRRIRPGGGDAVFVRIHRHAFVADVPDIVWELSRRGEYMSRLQWTTDDEIAALAARFGDDPPEWFARIAPPRPSDDFPL